MRFAQSIVSATLVAVVLGAAALTTAEASDQIASAKSVDTLVADNPRKGRRDNRQENRPDRREDRRECREDEGRLGNEKRECKQEERGEEDDVEAEAETDNA